MNKLPQSLKTRLFLWYAVSLFLMGIFVFLVIHVFALKNGLYFLIVLFITLAMFGFVIIYRITKFLTYLSSRMKTISSKNLDERVEKIESTDEIGELAFTFNNLLDRLHEAFKREQQFIADVAHELKTPLATLRTTLEVTLQQKRDTNEYEKAIKNALVETNRVSSTLKNVLDLAWSETPDEQKNAKKFNVTELMEELLELGQKMAIKKKVNVSGSFEKNLEILGSKEKLGRALLNIIDNAIKYSRSESTIEIRLKKERSQAVILVKDEDYGISQNDLPRIFDRFYRGSSTERTFGSGLGLAIARAIIVSHRGDINVKTKIGEGSVFTVSLPLA